MGQFGGLAGCFVRGINQTQISQRNRAAFGQAADYAIDE